MVLRDAAQVLDMSPGLFLVERVVVSGSSGCPSRDRRLRTLGERSQVGTLSGRSAARRTSMIRRMESGSARSAMISSVRSWVSAHRAQQSER